MAAIGTVIVTALFGITDPQPQAQILIILIVLAVAIILPIKAGATTLYFYALKLRKEEMNVERASPNIIPGKQ